jgi:hypothetical protein
MVFVVTLAPRHWSLAQSLCFVRFQFSGSIQAPSFCLRLITHEETILPH